LFDQGSQRSTRRFKTKSSRRSLTRQSWQKRVPTFDPKKSTAFELIGERRELFVARLLAAPTGAE
jgi:hypothetical protein